jgi:dinuclear metal center YbgI/SA1388 family protein
MTLLAELIEYLETRFPLSEAADWDAPGLSLGSTAQHISKALLSVDVTPQTLKQAADEGCQLIISHHPFLMRGVTTVAEGTLKGDLVAAAYRSGLAIYSAHTNADFASKGVSETLAKLLGLTELRPLVGAEGVVGVIPETKLLDYSRAVARALPSCAQGVLVQGGPDKLIRRVGLVAGAGDSYLSAAHAAGVDLYITSDLRHHPASDNRDTPGSPALMAIPHFAAEWPWLEVLAAELAAQFSSVEFVVSEINTDPWDFAVMQ